MQPVVAAGALRQYHRCVLSWRGTIVGIGKVVGGGGLFQDDRHHCGSVWLGVQRVDPSHAL